MILLFAKPTYGPSSDPQFDKTHRVAIMHAANSGIKWAGDVSPDRMGFASARNKVVESALETSKTMSVDGIFWVDDDMLIPAETVTRLVSYGHDFVSALYFQRGEPYWPLFAHFGKNEHFQFAMTYPEDVIAPVDGVGFGCVYTSMKMLRAVSDLPACKKEGPFGGEFGKKTYGEDFTFCLRARHAGFRPYVDTGLKCQHHIGPRFSNEDLFKQNGLYGGQ